MLLTITFSGLRVGMAAWRQGDARAEALQHGRSLNQLLVRALGGAHPYRVGTAGPDASPPLAFQGERDRLAFVTALPPIPLAAPIAFTAVALSRESDGLTIWEDALPNRDLFARLAPVLVDPTVAVLQFRYFRGRTGRGWSGGTRPPRRGCRPRSRSRSPTSRRSSCRSGWSRHETR